MTTKFELGIPTNLNNNHAATVGMADKTVMDIVILYESEHEYKRK